MTKIVLAALLSGLIGLRPTAAAIDSDPGTVRPAAKVLTSAQMQADFDLMRHALEEAHAGLYRYSTKPEMDRGFNVQRAKLSHPMTKFQFEAVVAETLALIRCGHTKCVDEELQAAMRNARTFPLRVLVEGRKLMIVLNDTPNNQSIRPGMEIVEINGQKVTDILSRIWPFISADGDIETGKRHDISGRFAEFYWWLVEQPDDFTIKARDAAGNTVTARLAGVTDTGRKSNQNLVNATMMASVSKLIGWSHDNQSLRFLKDPQVAEIRLRYFVGDSFPHWIEDTFKMLRDKGTRTLIIDLRGNGGGEDMYGAMLVSYLTDKPFRYFDHIDVKTFTPSFMEHTDLHLDEQTLVRLREMMIPNPAGGFLVSAKLHRGVAEQQPGQYPFLGKVFVLIDGGTFSTAADFCAVTHHLKRATFIGEETGGGYYGNNSGMMPTLTLPESKIGIRLPMYAYWNAVPGYRGTRRGTIPDCPVEFTTADVLRGVDAALELAVKSQ